MKNLDLATLGVEEMSEVQMQEVDGGGWWPELVAGYLITEWGNIKKAVNDAVKEYNYN